MGNLSTFTVFQGHIFWSRSFQGQINIAQFHICYTYDTSQYTVMYHRYTKYESDKHNGY